MLVVQPYKGLISITVALCVAAAVIGAVSFDFFVGELAVYCIAITPVLIVMDDIGAEALPGFIRTAPQPLQGLMKLLLAALIAIIPYLITIAVAGRGLPSSSYYMIPVVPVTLWSVIILGAFPWRHIFTNPKLSALGVLISCYAACWPIYFLLFDMGGFAGTPFYNPAYFADGLFNADHALTIIIAHALMIMISAALEFWPSRAICGLITKQPAAWLMPAISTALISAGAFALWGLFTGPLGWDIASFQVRIVVSSIFGMFICLMIFETWPVQKQAQPIKGIALVIIAAVIGQAMFQLYSAAMPLFATPDQINAAQYAWLASAMLGITFPSIVIYCRLLNRWPLREVA